MERTDFDGVKAAVTLEQAARWLGLELTRHGDTFRCACPVCKQGGERCIVITPAKRVCYDFSLKRGGDVIFLVAHIKGTGQREAAQLLQQQFMREPEKPKPQKRNRQTSRSIKPKKPVGGTVPEREYTIYDWMQEFA